MESISSFNRVSTVTDTIFQLALLVFLMEGTTHVPLDPDISGERDSCSRGNIGIATHTSQTSKTVKEKTDVIFM